MKKKKTTNGETSTAASVERDFKLVTKRRGSGELLSPGDLDVVLRKAAEEMRSYVKNHKKVSPIEYVSKSLGIEVPALNSYFFTSYGVFQKDVAEKVNPYVAYTVSVIHALNLGFLLGTIEKGKKDGTKNSTRKAKRK